MSGNPVIDGLVTLALLAAAGVSLGLLFRERAVEHRVGSVLHVVMALAMVAMMWGWDAGLPYALGAAFFAVSALLYAVLTVRGRLDAQRHPRHSSWAEALHALMFATMAWMYVAMPQGSSGTGAMHHAAHAAALSAPSALTGTLLLAAMVAGAFAFAWDRFDPPADVSVAVDGVAVVQHRHVESLGGGLMCAAMAVAMMPMLLT